MSNQHLRKFLSIIFMIGHSIYAISSNAENKVILQAQSYLEQGQYILALQEVDNVLKNVSANSVRAQALGLKGNILLRDKKFDRARTFLEQAYDLVEELPQKAGYANSLGLLYHEMGDIKRRNDFFVKALELSKGDESLSLKIRLNQIHVQSQSETIDQSLLGELLAEIANIKSLDERVRYYLNIAEVIKSSEPENLSKIQIIFERLYAAKDSITEKHLKLELFDGLAALYEELGLYQNASRVGEQAVTLAKQIDADDLMMHIEWRNGRIFDFLGQNDDALLAYGRAVDYVEAVRWDIPLEYKKGKSSFIETLGGVYLGYARLLLKKSGNQEGELKQETLKLVRKIIEKIKQTELEEFLGARCLTEGVAQFELSGMDKQAAILYPIILPDSLELLLGIGDTIRHYTIPVSENRVRQAAFQIAYMLRAEQDNYQELLIDLYQWLIAPIQKDLDNKNINTLVIVPDGVLRLVPFAALSNGRNYLIEKYAVSISPGMSLLNNKNINTNPKDYRMLLAGLSTPGSVVEKISKPEAITESEFKKQLSLPNVENELNSLKSIVRSDTLLNEQFTVSNFDQLIKEKSYEIVHIASHGIFSSDDNNSYLMAYDEKLKLSSLKKLLKRDKDSQVGIQLLTLSACQTAEGDDRAPLGFAGAALKAEALSALGSLWQVSDEATAQLMANFYKHFVQSTGKAESLRKAQLEILQEPKTVHPYYWAPFILVGSWL